MYDHTFFLKTCKLPDQTLGHTWNGLPAWCLYMATSIFLWGLSEYIWINILTYDPWGWQDVICSVFMNYVWLKYDLGQKHHAPKLQPSWCLNPWPLDHDSIFHVTETPAISTRPSVASSLQLFVLCCVLIVNNVYSLWILLKFAFSNWNFCGGT